MSTRDERQAELLDQYWSALTRDPAATLPAGLDAGIAAASRIVALGTVAGEPDPGFADLLLQRLTMSHVEHEQDSGAIALIPLYRNGVNPTTTGTASVSPQGAPVVAHAQPTSMLPRAPKPTGAVSGSKARPWLKPARLSTAALVLLAVIAVSLWSSRPDAVSAREIVERVQAVGSVPSANSVHSFAITTRITAEPGAGAVFIAARPGDVVFAGAPVAGGERIDVEVQQWYEAPGKLRAESTIALPSGKTQFVLINDGRAVTSYSPAEAIAYKSGLPLAGAAPNAGGAVRVVGPGLAAAGFDELFTTKIDCLSVHLEGDDAVVAGRSAYVLGLDPRPSACGSPPGPAVFGKSLMWVDKETFFILKSIDFSADDGRPLTTSEVTSIAYNVPIDPRRFVFAPPVGVTVQTVAPTPGSIAPGDGVPGAFIRPLPVGPDPPPGGLPPRAPQPVPGGPPRP
jgi:outer membrane lipoprotein-sorting protein